MTKLAVKLMPGGKLPVRSTEMAGAWDMFARTVKVHDDNGFTRAVVTLGCSMQPVDENYRVMVQPRSSITKTGWVMQNSPGLGDPDFPGEYQLRLVFIPAPYVTWEPPCEVGDRIAQMYLERIEPVEIVLLDDSEELPHQTDRTGGFGSTGKK